MGAFSLVASLLVVLGWMAFGIGALIFYIIAAFLLYYNNYRVSPEMKIWRLQALYCECQIIFYDF